MTTRTWREIITSELGDTGESWADVVSCTLTEQELDVEFDAGFGGTEGKPFTLWTAKRVYFPTEYDGAEWAGSAARDPDGQPTEHI